MSLNRNGPRKLSCRCVVSVDRKFRRQRWRSMSALSSWTLAGRSDRWLQMPNAVLLTCSTQEQTSLRHYGRLRANEQISFLPRKKTRSNGNNWKKRNGSGREKGRRWSGMVTQHLLLLSQSDFNQEQISMNRLRLYIGQKGLQAKKVISDLDRLWHSQKLQYQNLSLAFSPRQVHLQELPCLQLRIHRQRHLLRKLISSIPAILLNSHMLTLNKAINNSNIR